jgi:hypothetical protein
MNKEKPSLYDTKAAASLTALIMLLKRKGIITNEEVDELHKEASRITAFAIARDILEEDEKLK